METDLTEAEALTEIEEAYAAEMGAAEVEDPSGDRNTALRPQRKKTTPPPEAGS